MDMDIILLVVEVNSLPLLDRVYTYCILHFASVFTEHTTKYKTLTIHLLYFIQISCPQKNKL